VAGTSWSGLSSIPGCLNPTLVRLGRSTVRLGWQSLGRPTTNGPPLSNAVGGNTLTTFGAHNRLTDSTTGITILSGAAGEAHGDVPVSVVGNSLGGRAAFRAAGDRTVVSVVGVAPWLPEGEPVDQLAGRWVLIMHGDRDRGDASAAWSLDYASRARAVVPDLARFEVVGDNHYLLRRAPDGWAMATAFVSATTGSRPMHPAIAEAMAASGPDGLRTPLLVGFQAAAA
jgi:pimeloyl-ACP methyl ester carboxylesterase